MCSAGRVQWVHSVRESVVLHGGEKNRMRGSLRIVSTVLEIRVSSKKDLVYSSENTEA